ncbi:MAG: tRNA guanosine(15) transglycosylase TgtA [Hadesarchaea archaeon]|nr:MAG: tRNA guanosine(15) transglycosylase TgtA [Hadesarchaea archaeon]TDA35737.1 MAG: tRNA guanosine(15) transglycosylase TgtA [Hadesarchaea archaeon]
MPEEIFSIIHREGLGRLGRLWTRHGTVLTPTLLPVLDPFDLVLTPEEIRKEFGEPLMMTNAYFLKKKFGGGRKIQEMLGYEGPIATDSGGYQILRYGGIDADPDEIVKYQEEIGSDIAVILDVPTGARASKEQARKTVEITVERARRALKMRSDPEILWCAPVQGGKHLELVAECAKAVGSLDYQMHAVGSPVEFLEGYEYAELVDLVMTAKQNLPLDRPLHLFGAGHPSVLPLLVLMGCDTFDSASYILYARDGRYLTRERTLNLEELSFLPCECPICSSQTPEDLREKPEEERVKELARHNLHVLFGEVRRIRQALVDGRLWEYTELRCRSHPRLLEGFRRFLDYVEFVERFDPLTKPSAFFYLGMESFKRPEVLRHERRMEEYEPPPLPELLLLPCFERKEVKRGEGVHLVRILPPFGVVPEELEELYPLGQVVAPRKLEKEEIERMCLSLSRYLEKHGRKYRRIVLLNDRKRWGDRLKEICLNSGLRVEVVET